jgi:AraC family transcriptional regulator of adaptative response/methylated-DNA-[protein]-cysteine methyltransferase
MYKRRQVETSADYFIELLCFCRGDAWHRLTVPQCVHFDSNLRIASPWQVRDNVRMKLTQATMWTAVVERDRRFDGQFVYAVKTTRVYCRPTCPSKRPNEKNVEFFQTAEPAHTAGYRACRRCRPDASENRTESIVMKARNYIEENLDKTLTLADIGKASGISQFHLQRLFKAETGLTPRQYADECRLAAVKKELRSGRDVTAAMYEAGYSSSSRLYERSSQKLGMTPATYGKRGAGETIDCAFLRSPLGLVLIAATKKGLCFLQFGETKAELMQSLRDEFAAAAIEESAGTMSPWLENLSDYFAGKSAASSLPVDLRGTAFQQAVWHYLRMIPPGETRTYSQVAEGIGQPRAVRAVANACASNRVALAVPCHRVIRNDGSAGGYRWGVERKDALLKQEAVE